jgi:hypothetical protein
MTVERIVIDLAALDPRGDEGYCALCGEFTSSRVVTKMGQENVPSMHLESCPWRRAKEHVDGVNNEHQT